MSEKITKIVDSHNAAYLEVNAEDIGVRMDFIKSLLIRAQLPCDFTSAISLIGLAIETIGVTTRMDDVEKLRANFDSLSDSMFKLLNWEETIRQILEKKERLDE